MHYYQFNIADYRKDTGHLTLLEHGIYRQLLDTYYLDEKPIKTQLVIRRLAIKTQEEKEALTNVLNDFFQLSECGGFYTKERCISEIAQYHAKAETARSNGSKGGRPKKPKKTQPVNLAIPEKTTLKANHKPLTNNHKPIKDMSKKIPFDDFYKKYPVKKSKAEAEKRWKSMTVAMQEIAISGIDSYLKSVDDYKYAVHPSTYLNQKRWEDEITTGANVPIINKSPQLAARNVI